MASLVAALHLPGFFLMVIVVAPKNIRKTREKIRRGKFKWYSIRLTKNKNLYICRAGQRYVIHQRSLNIEAATS